MQTLEIRVCVFGGYFAAEMTGLDAADGWCGAQQVNTGGKKGAPINQSSGRFSGFPLWQLKEEL